MTARDRVRFRVLRDGSVSALAIKSSVPAGLLRRSVQAQSHCAFVQSYGSTWLAPIE